MTAETPTFLDADTEPPCPAPDAVPEKAGRVDQVPAQRHAAILEFVRLHGAVSVQDLAESLGASRSTVRRDLDYLSTHNYLERTHGGAQLPLAQRASPEVDSAISTHIAQRQKAAIGRAAARMVQPGQTVILDSGTTVLEAARALAGLGIAFRAITNDLAIAQVLGAASGVSVIVAGGTLRPGSPTLLGSIGISLLRDVHADLTLLGAHAVTGQTVTDSSLELIDIKRAMIAAAARTVALIDSSKFGPPSNFTICEMDRVADLVSDTGLAAEAREALRPCGTQVTLVEPA